MIDCSDEAEAAAAADGFQQLDELNLLAESSHDGVWESAKKWQLHAF